MSTSRFRSYARRAAAALLLTALLCGGFCRWGAFGAAARDENLSAPNSRVVKSRAERTILDSINYLEGLSSLKTEFSYETRIFGKTYSGHGEYVEQSVQSARSLRPRLEQTPFRLIASMNVDSDSPKSVEKDGEDSAADAPPKLEITCDYERRMWWRYNSTEETPLSQIDVQDLTASLTHLSDEENKRLAENGVTGSCGMNGMPGLGGIPGTLKRLLSYYDFDPEVENVLANAGTGDEKGTDGGAPTDISLVKVSGEANVRFFDRVKANQTKSYDTIPDYIRENLPVCVDIYFGMVKVKTYAGGKVEQRLRPFPYRIVYYSSKQDGKSRRPENLQLLFAVDYHKVECNEESGINKEVFQFDLQQATFDRIAAKYVQEISKPIGSRSSALD